MLVVRMAQAQLQTFRLWLELEKVARDISLPEEINTEENYSLFLAQTSTPKQFHKFLSKYLWMVEEEAITSVTKLTAFVSKITNHLQILHPGNIRGFEKVKQFYCHTIKYVFFISNA